MRFYWFHTSVQSSTVGSSAISVAAHAVLVGLAVYGTAVRARELQDEKDQLATNASYVLPPDRRPTQDAVTEHLAYIDVGAGATATEKPQLDGKAQKAAEAKEAPTPGGDAGKEADAQSPAAPNISADSVFSVLEVEERAVRAEGSAAPAYPPELVKSGTEGGVFIRFIVDTTGYPDLASMEILRSTNAAFSQSVRDALPLMRFTPATVGGHRVRQAVEQNFEFKIITPHVIELKKQPVT